MTAGRLRLNNVGKCRCFLAEEIHLRLLIRHLSPLHLLAS